MKKALCILFLLSLTMLFACSAGDQGGYETIATLETVPGEFSGAKNPLGTDAARAGEQVFRSACQSCHGTQGRGDGPAAGYLDPHPRNLADLQLQAGDDYLFWRISSGRSGTAMIGWQGILTQEQIWQLVAFLRTLN